MDRAFFAFFDLAYCVSRFVLGLPRFEVVLRYCCIDVVVGTDPLCGRFRYILFHLFYYYLSFTGRLILIGKTSFSD